MRIISKIIYNAKARIPNDINKIPTNGKLIHFKKLIVQQAPMSIDLVGQLFFISLLLFSIRIIETAGMMNISIIIIVPAFNNELLNHRIKKKLYAFFWH